MINFGWKHGQDYQVLDVANDKSVVFITGNHQLLTVSPELGARLRPLAVGLPWCPAVATDALVHQEHED